MVDDVKNFAYTTVTTPPSPATTGTSVTVANGAALPNAPFSVAVWPAGVQPLAGNAEILRVTAKSTNVLTVTRNQEGSTTRTIVAGDQLAQVITRQMVLDLQAVTAADLPAKSVMTTTCSGGVGVRPTSRTDILVIFVGPDADPPTVTSPSVAGMYVGDIHVVTA